MFKMFFSLHTYSTFVIAYISFSDKFVKLSEMLACSQVSYVHMVGKYMVVMSFHIDNLMIEAYHVNLELYIIGDFTAMNVMD